MKIANDKYYTPINIANYIWDKTYEIIGEENISEVIEPSVGNGSFLHHPKYMVHFAYDILPECNSTLTCITKGDYLEQEMGYLHGRLIIGNPPYGKCLSMAQKFYKKSIMIGDYIAFILPISQLNNRWAFYEFDLVYSEDLGNLIYSGRELHCCFNIYRRPLSGEFNSKVVDTLKDVTIYRQDCKDYKTKPYDIRICRRGSSFGKVLKDSENYAGEYKIKINRVDIKDKVIEVFNTFDWQSYLKGISIKGIQKYHIIDVLKSRIKDIY